MCRTSEKFMNSSRTRCCLRKLTVQHMNSKSCHFLLWHFPNFNCQLKLVAFLLHHQCIWAHGRRFMLNWRVQCHNSPQLRQDDLYSFMSHVQSIDIEFHWQRTTSEIAFWSVKNWIFFFSSIIMNFAHCFFSELAVELDFYRLIAVCGLRTICLSFTLIDYSFTGT